MANGIVLNIDTTKSEFQNPMVQLRQGDGNYQSLDVTVTSNGEPFDLTDWTITFMGTTAGGFKIIDAASVVSNALQGQFTYTPTKAWGQDQGEFKNAYFKFVKSDKTASGASFRVNVLDAVDLTAEEAKDYISVVDDLVVQVKNDLDSKLETTKQTLSTTQSDVSTLRENVNDLKEQNNNIRTSDNIWTGTNKFTRLIDGAFKGRQATFTDFATVALDMPTYSGNWFTAQNIHIDNSPYQNSWGIVEVIPGDAPQSGLIIFTPYDPTDGYIYYNVVSFGGLKKWFKIAKDDTVVHTTGDETISGNKTFSNPIIGSVTGSATKLQTPRTINGVSFDGTSNIEITGANALPVAGVYQTLADLVAANPDHNHVYITADNGNWNYWNITNSAWTAGGIYQASGNNIVSGEINYANPNVAPFNDLDTLPLNKIVTYATSEIKNVAHVPSSLSKDLNGATVYTLSNDSKLAGSVQYFVGEDNVTYSRIAWGNPAHYSEWKTAANGNFYLGGKMVGAQTGVPYDDLNTFPMNQTVVIAETPQTIGQIKNLPNIGPNVGGLNVTSHSWSNRSIGGIQIAIDTDNVMYHRIAWGSDNNWGAWRSDTKDNSINMSDIYPSMSMFQKLGVIGDSYASGELAFDGTNVDHYEISWIQQIARRVGANATNFSYGGSQTRHWLLADKGLNLLNSADPQELYVLALGINDRDMFGVSYIGVESDIDSGADTYFGNYGKIIKAVIAKAPASKIVLATLAGYTDATNQFNTAIRTLGSHFGIPVIELNSDPLFTSAFYNNNMVGGHPTAPVYASMSKAYQRLIEKQMFTSFSYFSTYKK